MSGFTSDLVMYHILQVASCQIRQKVEFLVILFRIGMTKRNELYGSEEKANQVRLISSRPLFLEYRPFQPRQFPHL